MHGSPQVHQITPPAMQAAQRQLGAGQARAQRLISKIEIQCLGQPAVLEIGALRAMVRNLCAEVAAFENDDGTHEVEFDGITYGVFLTGGRFEYAQINGVDVTRLLTRAQQSALEMLAIEREREAA